MQFRKVTEDEADKCYEMIDLVRNKMIADGRHQWTASYPSRETVENDIRQQNAWVLDNHGHIIAYGACIVNGEPEYAHIIGRWQTQQTYMVVHRLAVAVDARGFGHGKQFLRETEKLCRTMNIHSIKVDTNYDNREMINLLSRLGYVICGQIDYGERGRRFAFEKVLA